MSTYIYMHIHVPLYLCGSVFLCVAAHDECRISVECVSSGSLAAHGALKGTSVRMWHSLIAICNKSAINS